MADKKDDPAREYRAYLEQWLERDDQQRTLRPTVVRMLGTGVWQEEAMGVLRGASPMMASEVDSDIARSLIALKTTLPLPTAYEPTTTLSSSAVAVSSNAVVFNALVSAQTHQPEPALTKQIARYQALSAEQGRAAEAGRRIGKLFPPLSQRFADVQDAVQGAQGNQREEERAAMEMRTFLAKLKGELFSMAARHMGENMKWGLMAERLGRDDVGRQQLLEQEVTHIGLIATLSNIGKARTTGYDFSQAVTRFVDHVFVVCGEVLVGKA